MKKLLSITCLLTSIICLGSTNSINPQRRSRETQDIINSLYSPQLSSEESIANKQAQKIINRYLKNNPRDPRAFLTIINSIPELQTNTQATYITVQDTIYFSCVRKGFKTTWVRYGV